MSLEVHTSSYRAVRGYTIVTAVCDEMAFWRDETSANPDVEILNALRPAMATVPGALLLCISTPYARRGALWDAFRKHHGKPDAAVLVWTADTESMNPSIDTRAIRDAWSWTCRRWRAAPAAAPGSDPGRNSSRRTVSLDALAALQTSRTLPGLPRRGGLPRRRPPLHWPLRRGGLPRGGLPRRGTTPACGLPRLACERPTRRRPPPFAP